MNCRQIREALLVERALCPEQVAHLSNCARCGEYARTLEKNRALLTSLTPVQPSRALTAEALRRGLEQPSRPDLRSRAWGRVLLPAAGAALAAAAGIAILHRPLPTKLTHGASPSVRRDQAPRHLPSERETATTSGSMPDHGTTSTPPSGAGSARAHVTALQPYRQPAPASAPGARATQTPNPPRVVAEDEYLDGRRCPAATWLTSSPAEERRLQALLRHLPVPREDFVRVPLPRFASTRTAGAGNAIREYEEQAKIVDVRLSRRVTLQVKGMSLEQLGAELARQSGVSFRLQRGVTDEKVTLFVDDTPLREVMREVARLFGFFWSRVGEEGKYRYTLEQDLRSQLGEEELRNRDEHAALLDLDGKMAQYAGLLDLNRDQIKQRLTGAKGEEASRLQALLTGAWGGHQVYRRLSPAERIALATGETLTYDQGDSDPSRRLPEEIWNPLRQGFWAGTVYFGGHAVQVPANAPGVNQMIQLKVSRSELGQLTLTSSSIITWKGEDGHQAGGVGTNDTLALGQSPSTANPQNAVLNAALKKDPSFQREVALAPVPSCPQFQMQSPGEKQRRVPGFGNGMEYRKAMAAVQHANGEKPGPHVTSADVWEEVHRRTGLPIVADYYTRLYDQRGVTVTRTDLFDALARVGDTLGVRWRKDGSFLLARSTAYFWDKLKEVPVRHLERWRKERAEAGLPFADLLEMAQLSDRQLTSGVVGAAIPHCWGIEEWNILPPVVDDRKPLDWLRFLAAHPELVADALKPEGFAYSAANPREQDEIRSLLAVDGLTPPVDFQQSRFRVEYVPAGRYVWVRRRDQAQGKAYPLIAEPTFEAALAAARRVDPGATEDRIARSEGIFAVKLSAPGGWAGVVAGESPVD